MAPASSGALTKKNTHQSVFSALCSSGTTVQRASRQHTPIVSLRRLLLKRFRIFLDSVDQPQVLKRPHAAVRHVCSRHGYGRHAHSRKHTVPAGVEIVERYVDGVGEGASAVLERRAVRAVAVVARGEHTRWGGVDRRQARRVSKRLVGGRRQNDKSSHSSLRIKYGSTRGNS